jgi:hypothetical protein
MANPDAIIDEPTVGKHVKVRAHMKNDDGERMQGHFVGVVREVKRGGACLVIDNGWNMNLDGDDELIWCADYPAPGYIR